MNPKAMTGALLVLVLAGCPATPVVEPPAIVEPPADPGTERTVIIILGASYAAGWAPPAAGGLRFVNKGEGGQQSFEMLERFDRDVVANRPQAVILWGYINDIFRSDKGKLEAAKRRARESYLEMIRLARDHGIEPVLATEVTIRQKAGFKEFAAGTIGSILGKTSYQDRINGHVVELNDWLRELAGSEGLLLLDFEKVLSGPDGRRKKGFANDDGSHITAAGYEALDRYACGILDEHFREESVPVDR